MTHPIARGFDTIVDAGETLIIGAGLAGLFTALKLAPAPCVVLSPVALGDGASSTWAQGGLAAAIGEGDTPEAHAADTIAAGAGLVDPEIAQIVTAEARDAVLDLLSFGAPFDRDATGTLLQSKEAAHSANRVVRVSGDRAGRAIMDALIAKARQTPSIQIFEGITVDDLAVQDGRVVGAFGHRNLDTHVTPHFFRARNVVLATGGIGGMFAVTTNPRGVSGQGLGMAARAGAVIRDAEFVQFHPTGMAVGQDPCPLATEALRGHGAHVIDETGHRFILDDHPDGELAPRDIVARSIFARLQSGHQVFLDTRAAIGEAILSDFPTVSAYCQDAGIDPVTQPIPIHPAQHYHMGGVATDAQGKTSLPGLWACGEVACTGLHGANRLASNSLLEAVVFARRIADALSGESHAHRATAPMPPLSNITRQPEAGISTLRATMNQNLGLIRHADGMHHALSVIAELESAPVLGRGFANMLVAARLITTSALRRENSRGGHFRADYPKAKPAGSTPRDITLVEALNA